MTLTELRYIVAVAQERHFGRAARRCFVSQPTLSIAIKKLEEELSVSLLKFRKKELEDKDLSLTDTMKWIKETLYLLDE